ncbi:hypothetical protein SADUNF_Sadunf16G0038100 [Salix dunnii]|uniref:Uncharacterized protein n=1 Tax=Salix dunnii TaxID=1413687 RepID=A0A835MP93_9ROSI|nr:hypothetical protein SADUNF_Sadunf16G0038100 [Salix dunnii]
MLSKFQYLVSNVAIKPTANVTGSHPQPQPGRTCSLKKESHDSVLRTGNQKFLKTNFSLLFQGYPTETLTSGSSPPREKKRRFKRLLIQICCCLFGTSETCL